MGNGRLPGRSLGRALGAMFVLLCAGSLLLGLSSVRQAQRAASALPASPISTFSRGSVSTASLHAKPSANSILGQLPMIFEPNLGQADSPVKFLARGAGYSLFLEPTSAVLALRSALQSTAANRESFVRMNLVGANPAAATVGSDPLPGKSNYVIGNDPKKWHSGVPQFSGVHYANVYPGIDLVFYGSQGHLEYDFKVAPGADPLQAELQFDGASQLKLSGGDLILTAADAGGLRLHAPQVYQRDGEHRQAVAGRFVMRADNHVGLEIGAYDHNRELIIDPVLDFSSYFGGNGSVSSPSIAVNGSDIYLTGSTTLATGFPGQGISTQIGTGNGIFVAKIVPSQPPAVLYLTFLGGTGTDTSVGIGVDNGGKAYIVGNTTSTNFPTDMTNVLGYQTSPKAKGPQCAAPAVCKSVFLTVLNASGAAPLFYSSYLSGTGDDEASGMTIDGQGDVFITGTTTSNDVPSITDAFPATFLPVPFQTQSVSSIQFFVTKVNTIVPSTGGIAYSTYFGGGTPVPPIATGGGIAVDTIGNVYFTGTTNFFNSGAGQFGNSGLSGDFPILNAYQPCLDMVPPITRTNVNPCTTPATPYPTDAFVAKLNPNAAAGSQLLFSTYFGGANTDSSTAIAIDSGAANIYITGATNSIDIVLPTGTAAFQSCLDTPPPNVLPCPMASANPDAYVARLSNPVLSVTGTPNNVALTYFSYLGGAGTENGSAIGVLNASTTTLGDVVLTGSTDSINFPVTTGAIQSQLGTGATQNAFFAQIDTTTTIGNNGVGSYSTYFGGNGSDRGTSIAVDANQNSYFAGDTTSTNLQVVDPLPGSGGTTFSGTKDAFVVKLGSAANLAIQPPTISPAGVVSAGNQVTTTFTIANEGPDPASFITVTGVASSGMTFASATAGSGTCSPPSGNTAVCTIPALQSGSTSAVVFTVTPGSTGNYSVTATVTSSNNTSSNQPDSATASFTAGGFKMSVNPPARNVIAGSLATYNVQLNPNTVFGSTVSFTCGAVPAATICNFTPSNSVTLTNGAQSVTMNLQTTPQPVNTASAALGSRRFALWLMIPGMAVLWGASGKRAARRGVRGMISRLLGVLTLCTLFALVLLQPSCSSAKTPATVGGTPTGTYTLTVTATSGSFSQTQSFSLTVTP
jgi:uncharacterized repeat protein (TIGR01451 family)